MAKQTQSRETLERTEPRPSTDKRGGAQPDCRLVAWSNTYVSPKAGKRSDCRLAAYSNTYSTSYIRGSSRGWTS
jgi:hypothetical protein